MTNMNTLDRPVVVLNRGFIPICHVTARKAIGMLIDGKAKILMPDWRVKTWDEWSDIPHGADDLIVRTPNRTFAVPPVVVLHRLDQFKAREVKFSRRNIMTRDDYTCQYCGDQPPVRQITLDHVMPSSRGGKTVWTNIVSACLKCNSLKSDKTPEEAGMKLLSKPTKPKKIPVFSTPELDSIEGRSSRFEPYRSLLDIAYWNVPLKS